MSRNLVLVGCLLACLQSICSSPVPFIKKCKVSDAKCIKASTQIAIPIFGKGIPEYGVETMDPFLIDKIDGSSDTLKLHVKDITLTGFSQCVAKKLQIIPDQKKMVAKLQCTLDAKGIYDMDGNLLLLKIVGNGDAHVVLRKLLLSVEAALNEVTGADGQIHWSIGKWKHSYELKDQSTVELDNLFNGNELLGRAARDLIASSPNDIVVEVGPPIVKAVVAKVIKNVNVFFAKVPMSDLVE